MNTTQTNPLFTPKALLTPLLLLMLSARLSAVVPPPNGPGKALSFDGVNDRLTTTVGGGFSDWLPAGNSPYTIEAWINTTAMRAGTVAAWGNFGTANQVNAFRLTPTGLVNYWWGNDLYATTNLVGGWHHVAATFDGTNRRILVDGTVLSSDTPTGHNSVTANFSIGAANNAEFFSGQMDEVRIWNIGRTAAQIREAMRRQLWGNESGLVAYWRFDDANELSASDATGKAASVTLVNGPAWVDSNISPFAPTVSARLGSLTSTSATLEGTVGHEGSAWFEWGYPTLSNVTRTMTFSGLGELYWSEPISGVSPGQLEAFRAVATNIHGRSYSPTISFTMPVLTNVVFNLNDSGYGSLREVIRNLPAGETIRFAPQLTGTIAVTNGEIVIPRSMRIEGPGADRLTLDGNRSNRLFRVTAGQVHISGFSMNLGRIVGTNGNNALGDQAAGNGQSAEGGAVLNLADLTVSDCIFDRNTAIGGIGGAGLSGSPFNEPEHGGQGGTGAGGAVANYGNLTIANSLFRVNQAIGGRGGPGGDNLAGYTGYGATGGFGGDSYGGAILNHGVLSLSNCIFSDSFAKAGAGATGGSGRIWGGLGGQGGNVYGGGLWSDGSLTLINCTFDREDAIAGQGGIGGNGGTFGPGGAGGTAFGGAIFESGGGTMIHCTVARSECFGGSGGQGDPNGPVGSAFAGGIATRSDGRLIVLNTVIASNDVTGNGYPAPDVAGTFASLGHNFIGKKDAYSSGWSSSDIVGTTAAPKDPKVASNDDYSLSPMRGSPLINAGDDSVLGPPLYLATDQRGGSRRSLGHVDIGAVEVGSALRITSLQTNRTGLDVSFTTEYGFPYHLESKDTCSPGAWTPFGPIAVIGDRSVMTVTDTRARAATNRFYRVVLAP